MIIPLDDKTRIRGTTECWQLEIAKVVKGEVEWRPYKYLNSMDRALHEAAQPEIRTSEASGLTEALAACEAVTAKYAKIFDDVGLRVAGDTNLTARDQLAEAERIERQSLT